MENLHYNPLITIIIPVFNAEKFIERAVNSVKRQSYSNWNLILVDDGSTDNSLTVCNKIAASDNRIQVFHKKNGGEASARNFGLEHANGEYICYIDADDHVSSNLIEDYLGTKPMDLSICGIDMRWGKRYESIGICNGEYEGDSILEIISSFNILLIGSSCNKLFKRSIIETNNLRYPENQFGIGIDHAFNWKYFQKCHTMRAVNKLNYIYEENPDSLSHEQSANNPERYTTTRLNLMYVLNTIMDDIKSKSLRGKCQKVYHSYFSDCIIRPLYMHRLGRHIRLKVLSGYKSELNKMDYCLWSAYKGLFNKALFLLGQLPVNISDYCYLMLFKLKKIVYR